MTEETIISTPESIGKLLETMYKGRELDRYWRDFRLDCLYVEGRGAVWPAKEARDRNFILVTSYATSLVTGQEWYSRVWVPVTGTLEARNRPLVACLYALTVRGDKIEEEANPSTRLSSSLPSASDEGGPDE